MQNQTNPLIGSTSADTMNNAVEALDALIVLLADSNSGVARLLMPIAHALEAGATQPPSPPSS
ncbi:hypothetical protein [Comamonas sp.]|uniref:hypothetical protein n=1 Tax=Comamonas sp. TaxID=34028 RepID=UPI00289CCDEA|nr:hypothetical protein [Comamonas sp.]